MDYGWKELMKYERLVLRVIILIKKKIVLLKDMGKSRHYSLKYQMLIK